jgi:hypothetical protein
VAWSSGCARRPLVEAEVEAAALAWLLQHLPAGSSPMCGNSIGQDRASSPLHMPRLEAFFHYRNIDISTLKELSRAWYPEQFAAFRKKTRHQALADVSRSRSTRRATTAKRGSVRPAETPPSSALAAWSICRAEVGLVAHLRALADPVAEVQVRQAAATAPVRIRRNTPQVPRLAPARSGS